MKHPSDGGNIAAPATPLFHWKGSTENRDINMAPKGILMSFHLFGDFAIREGQMPNSGLYANSPPSPCTLRNSFGGRAGVSWFAGGSDASGRAATEAFSGSPVPASRSSSDSSHSICD
jgi:hypothetical protein